MSSDLELVSTDDLWKELGRRFGALVLVYERDDDKNPDLSVHGLWFYGAPAHVNGLMSFAGEASRQREQYYVKRWLGGLRLSPDDDDEHDADGPSGNEER